MKPLHDRVIVSNVQTETKTSGGIILTETDRSKPVKGTVVSIGPICEHVKEGDTVLFHIYSTIELTYEVDKVYMIRECDIIGTIDL